MAAAIRQPGSRRSWSGSNGATSDMAVSNDLPQFRSESSNRRLSAAAVANWRGWGLPRCRPAVDSLRGLRGPNYRFALGHLDWFSRNRRGEKVRATWMTGNKGEKWWIGNVVILSPCPPPAPGEGAAPSTRASDAPLRDRKSVV